LDKPEIRGNPMELQNNRINNDLKTEEFINKNEDTTFYDNNFWTLNSHFNDDFFKDL
jgi:hypothetical protein